MYGLLEYEINFIDLIWKRPFFMGQFNGIKVLVADACQFNSQPKQQPDGLVAGSLDLVTMLLKARYCYGLSVFKHHRGGMVFY